MKKKSKKLGKRLTIIYAVILIVIFIFGIGIIVVKSPLYNKGLIGANKIAVIPIKGTIASSNGEGDFFRGGTTGSGSIIGFIEQASKDKNVKGIILNINSPGGTVVASKDIAAAVNKVDKPVVALIREVGASGAYWVASASDYIVADPLSVTGSIGVIGSYLEFSELFSEYGVKYQSVKTGKYKDLASPYKKLSPEEEKLLTGKLQIIHDYFVAEVNKNRGQDLTEYGNGLFYLGSEALDIGLVDELGGKDEAINAVKRMAGIEEYELILYQRQRTIFDVLTRLSEDFGFSIGEGFGSKVLAQDDFEIKLE